MGEEDPVPVIPPGEDVTVYTVMADPPSLAGAVKETDAEAFPAVAETPVGAPGTVAGVTDALGLLAEPIPTVLVALTVKV